MLTTYHGHILQGLKCSSLMVHVPNGKFHPRHSKQIRFNKKSMLGRCDGHCTKKYYRTLYVDQINTMHKNTPLRLPPGYTLLSFNDVNNDMLSRVASGMNHALLFTDPLYTVCCVFFHTFIMFFAGNETSLQ